MHGRCRMRTERNCKFIPRGSREKEALYCMRMGFAGQHPHTLAFPRRGGTVVRLLRSWAFSVRLAMQCAEWAVSIEPGNEGSGRSSWCEWITNLSEGNRSFPSARACSGRETGRFLLSAVCFDEMECLLECILLSMHAQPRQQHRMCDAAQMPWAQLLDAQA